MNMNKRKLKKSINLICESLFADCVAVSLYGPDAHKKNNEDMEALLFSIVKMHSHYIQRISHPEPGLPAKAYFTDLCEKFNAQVDNILDQVNL